MANNITLHLSREEALHLLKILEGDLRTVTLRQDLSHIDPKVSYEVTQRLSRLVNTSYVPVKVLSCRPLEPGESK